MPLLLVASQILTARDARRFVLVFVGVVAAWFVFLYPNISALPLPSSFANAYQRLLPTYLYPFQFGGEHRRARDATVSFAGRRGSRSCWCSSSSPAASSPTRRGSGGWRQAEERGAAPPARPGPAGEAGAA